MNEALLDHTDGQDITRPLTLDADLVIIGSGPAGSAFARVAAQAGATVIVVEEGPLVHHTPPPPDTWSAMIRSYRHMGASLTRARAPMPVVQGRCVGGGSVINGAIHWRLPRDVWDAWAEADPERAEQWGWDPLEDATDEVFARLGVAPTDRSVQGRNALLMQEGADALGLANRPIRRNTLGCLGTSRCMQGCPVGAKQHMGVTLLKDAVDAGAVVLSRVRAERVVHDDHLAAGVHAVSDGGAVVRLRARRAVVLAASAVQTPALLLRSGLRHGPVGRHFQAHPGAGVLGYFPEPVRCWEGATQGWEVTGLRERGLKMEALNVEQGMLASRLPGLGRDWAEAVDTGLDHWASWGVALKAGSEGRVTLRRGRASVRYGLDAADLRTLAAGIAWTGRMMFAAGAEAVLPSVRGLPTRVTDPSQLDVLDTAPPTDPRAYATVITHLFGTARAHSDPRRGVVRPDLRHHRINRLYVADSSVFPTNTGVNPQGSILAIATHAARSMMQSSPS